MPPRDLPPIAYGTAFLDEFDDGVGAVVDALETGYRFLDTATRYGTEGLVGEGLARADVNRDDVVVATKVNDDDLGYDDVIASANASRDRLGVDLIDLLYVHWPLGAYDPNETLPAFDDLFDRGVIDGVGISNFTPALVRDADDRLDAPLLAHQFELHPLLPQAELLALARELDHHPVAYGPTVKGRIFDDPQIAKIADEHGVSPAAISIAWIADRGATPIAASSDPDHRRANLAALDIDLTSTDRERIAAIGRTDRAYPDPADELADGSR
jgi:2,5-diketo-D-gluconate reductase B